MQLDQILQIKFIHNSSFIIPNSMHKPVLLNEIVSLLDPKPGEFFIDGTFGAGGHSKAILEKIGPTGKLLAMDWDKNVFKEYRTQNTEDRMQNTGFKFYVGNYADLPEILKELKLPKADGFLLDLGFSSDQLEHSGRGFSFRKDEPLLMTYSDQRKPVSQLLIELPEQEIADLIKNYGEERFAKKIAAAIKARMKKNPITTSGDLAEIIKMAVPKNYERGRIHPATRTFQALRIYANQELENLERLLKNLLEVVGPGGRVAIISFHSLEDRLVKNYFRDYAMGKAKVGQLKIITPKPIVAGGAEIAANPRARSAKLRAAQIL